jgi:hypothetical protein
MVDAAVWPWPGDSELARARKIAQAYREHLKLANPIVCRTLDEVMLAYGQTWVAPDEMGYDDGSAITTAQAALLVSVRVETIRQWACTPDPTDPTRMLLPRFRWDGRQRTYLVVNVKRAAQIAASTRLQR